MKQVGTHFTLLVVVLCLTAIALNWAAEQEEDTMNVWDAFLDTLENRGLASLDWEIEPDVQEELIAYFKAKIDAGVSDGKTLLPLD